jgi:hypothetical protein
MLQTYCLEFAMICSLVRLIFGAEEQFFTLVLFAPLQSPLAFSNQGPLLGHYKTGLETGSGRETRGTLDAITLAILNTATLVKGLAAGKGGIKEEVMGGVPSRNAGVGLNS